MTYRHRQPYHDDRGNEVTLADVLPRCACGALTDEDAECCDDCEEAA
jgi:hypothetical protein